MFFHRIRPVPGLSFGCGPGVAGALIRFWDWDWDWDWDQSQSQSQIMRLTLLLLSLLLLHRTPDLSSIVRSGEDSWPSDDIRPVVLYPLPSFLASQRQSMASRVLREHPPHQTSPAIAPYRALLPDIPPRHSDDRFSDFRGDIRASLTYRESIRLFDRPISLIGYMSLRRHFVGSCVLRYTNSLLYHIYA